MQKYENEEKFSEGKGIKGFTLSEIDDTRMHEMRNGHIKDNEDRNTYSEGTINKKRLLSPITTTSGSPALSKIVAFYAYMSQHTQSISVQYPLRFDVVKTNVGNGYHSPTGIFIVPESGIYVFSWTIRIYGGRRHATQLMVNTDEVGIIHTHLVGDSDFEGTGIVVIQVNAGDDVFVRAHASWNVGAIRSDIAGRTSFSGWKLS
ncbi:complement C1q-like protein 2 [Saccostrea cucullata]|uniref:complement C1q-like protein 2 n=1 Tax=Saccostrea cuccullata TaxID=36930 RepID=UPI002ED4EEEF